jgi:DNA mismatch repair protein MutS2
MTPVILLSDGYIANGAEPWKFPQAAGLPSIPVKFKTKLDDGELKFTPYSRNEKLARPWVTPGTPGLEHRIGGLEKQNITGNISYDPENHQLMVNLRQQKIDDIAEKYFNNKDKKTLIGELLKVVEIENSKRKKISAKEKKIKEVVVKQVIAEVNVKVEEIRTEKKENKIKAKLIPEKPVVVLKVGDRVRMKDGKAIGTIEKIEKNKVSVNYGVFISKTNLESLEYVQPS